jgi:hypothetical protein
MLLHCSVTCCLSHGLSDGIKALHRATGPGTEGVKSLAWVLEGWQGRRNVSPTETRFRREGT